MAEHEESNLENEDKKFTLANKNKKELLFLFHGKCLGNSVSPEEQKELSKLIKVTTKGYLGGMKVVTYSVDVKGPDDKAYANNPTLRIVLPRIMSLVFNSEKKFVTHLIGLNEFTGPDPGHEDADGWADARP